MKQKTEKMIKKKHRHFKINSLRKKVEITVLLHREISIDSFQFTSENNIFWSQMSQNFNNNFSAQNHGNKSKKPVASELILNDADLFSDLQDKMWPRNF